MSADDLVHTGNYYCVGASLARNYPVDFNGYMIVVAGAIIGGYTMQLYTPINNDMLYMRRQYSGAWGTWKSVAFT